MDQLTNPDAAKRIAQFVRMRDHIKQIEEKHKEELKPFKETLEKLSSALMDHLNTIGADSIATPFGTAHKTTKNSASIADMDAFWTWVITQGSFDMVDRKANVTAVGEFIKENGAPPPGVNWSSHQVVGVRRK